MKKTLLLMVLALMICSTDALAQKKRRQKEYDGFKWYILYCRGGEGALSKDKMVLIPCSRGYDRIYYEKSLGHPYFLVEKYWRHFGICDITGKEIISPKYDHIVFWSRKDYYEVELNGKKGVCDLNGKEIIPCEYNYLSCSSDGTYRIIKYEDSNGDWEELGIKFDEQGRVYSYTPSSSFGSSTNVSSNLVVDFEYFAYTSYKNGDIEQMVNYAGDMSQYIIRIDMKSSPGDILVKLMTENRDRKMETKESYLIKPSQSEFINKGDLTGIAFSVNGQRKAINIGTIKGQEKCFFFIDAISNNAPQNARLFLPTSCYRELSPTNSVLLEELVRMYNEKNKQNKILLEPSNFDTKYSQLKSALSRYKWKQ